MVLSKTILAVEHAPAIAGYLDVGDNVHANVCSWLDVNCGSSAERWFIPGTCEGHGHRYAKMIVCGKEWCPECSKVGGMAHNRRYVRWLSKIKQFDKMRYIVFTIPMQLRKYYRTKDSLKELGRSAQILMIKHGYKRGLRRWHWFGDKSNIWNPHLNVLVEGGYIKKQKIFEMMIDWAEILGIECTIKRGESGEIISVHGIDINFSYKSSPADKCGCLHYVTRSTFTDYNWDIDMALELRNFRNMVVWGRDWKQEYKWLPDDSIRQKSGLPLDTYSIERLLEHDCPICHSRLIWGKALPAKLLDLTDNLELGAGYYYTENRPGPGKDFELSWRASTLYLVKMAKILGAVEIREKSSEVK